MELVLQGGSRARACISYEVIHLERLGCSAAFGAVIGQERIRWRAVAAEGSGFVIRRRARPLMAWARVVRPAADDCCGVGDAVAGGVRTVSYVSLVLWVGSGWYGARGI